MNVRRGPRRSGDESFRVFSPPPACLYDQEHQTGPRKAIVGSMKPLRAGLHWVPRRLRWRGCRSRAGGLPFASSCALANCLQVWLQIDGTRGGKGSIVLAGAWRNIICTSIWRAVGQAASSTPDFPLPQCMVHTVNSGTADTRAHGFLRAWPWVVHYERWYDKRCWQAYSPRPPGMLSCHKPVVHSTWI